MLFYDKEIKVPQGLPDYVYEYLEEIEKASDEDRFFDYSRGIEEVESNMKQSVLDGTVTKDQFFLIMNIFGL